MKREKPFLYIQSVEDWYQSLNEKQQLRVCDWMSTILYMLGAVAIGLFLMYFVIIHSVIPSGSMLETIQLDDHIIGNRLAYTFSEPKRGDIIIFYAPDKSYMNPDTIYIKRLIGLPGETIDITNGVVTVTTKDGQVFVLQEDYLGSVDTASYGTFVVPEGHYFFLGDNRQSSYDARKWSNSYVPREDIIAKAVCKIYKNFEIYKTVKYDAN